MGNDQSRSHFGGILVPHPALRDPGECLWTAESNYTQTGPHCEMPKASDDYEIVLEASGTRTGKAADAAEDINVLCLQGGSPGRTSRAAGFAWKLSGDGANAYRGWEPPATFSAWETVTYQSTDGSKTRPHCCTLTNEAYRDRVVVVAEEAANNGIQAWYRTPAGAWSSAVTVHDGSTLPEAFRPCVLEVGDRVFILAWVKGRTSASTTYYLRSWVSTDGGATWAIARHAVTTEQDVTLAGGSGQYRLGRVRAAYKDGQILVVSNVALPTATTHSEGFRVWASSNLTQELTLVETWDPDTRDAGPHDLIVAGGFFVVGYVRRTGEFHTRRVGSAYQPLSTATESTAATPFTGGADVAAGPPTSITDADVAMVTADDGLVWLFWRYANTGGSSIDSTIVGYSEDDGETFSRYGIYADDRTDDDDAATVWRSESTGDHYVRRFSACWQRGRVVLLHNWKADTDTNDNSICAAYLGGYHNLTLPITREGVLFEDRCTYEHTRLPIERAQDSAKWGATTAGTSTNTLGDGYEQFTTGNGSGSNGVVYVDYADTQTGDIAWIGTWAVNVQGGGSRTAGNISLQVRLDDNTQGFEVGVYMDGTSFGVYDVVAASELFNVQSLANVTREWRMGVYVNEAGSTTAVRVWYRNYSMEEDREWTFAGSGTLTDDGGTIGNNRVRYGNVVSAGASTQVVSRWYHGPHFSFGNIGNADNNAGTLAHWHDWVTATNNPGDLAPRLYSTRHVYVEDGASIRAVAGPAIKGDAHDIATAYEYPIEALFPFYSRSKRYRWRSVDDSSAQNIALYFDDGLIDTQESEPADPLWGLYLGGINWRTGELQRYDVGTTSWVKIADIDAASGLTGLSYSRQGATLAPAGSDSARFLRHELAGFTASLNGTERAVRSNTAGVWKSSSTAPRARIILDGAESGDPTGTGTLDLWAPEVLVLFHQSDDTAGYRIVIDAQDTVDGHFEIGAMALGPVHVFAHPHDRGRSLSLQQGAVVRQRQDGSTTIQNPAPERREVEVTWQDGISEGSYWSTASDPDYVRTTSTGSVDAAGMTGTVGYDFFGVVYDLKGQPCVFIPRIEKGTPDTQTLIRRDEMVYGYVSSNPEIVDRHGDERESVLHELGRVTFTEEL